MNSAQQPDSVTTQAERELLTAGELAQALKVSKAAVRAWQRRGVPFVPIGRLRRYVLAEVIQWHRQRASEKQAARA
jgi:phage terminase Nu1 subunit (DNA packaging protein)